MNRILQVGVKVLLKNSDGKILLLKRSQEKYGKTNGSWDIPGGRIEPGSELLENLQREVKEETALELTSIPKLIAAQDILLPDKHVVRLTYVAYTKGLPVLDITENKESRWVSFHELKADDDVDVYVKMLLETGKLTDSSW